MVRAVRDASSVNVSRTDHFKEDKMNGAEALVKCLELEGISTVFGYPGVAIAPFYDAMARSSIRHILVRQEQAAGHAANGYARISR